jgi:hypothetical protein
MNMDQKGRKNKNQIRRVAKTTSTAPGVAFPLVTNELVEIVLSRGVPDHLRSFETLKNFLNNSFYGEQCMEDFFLALAEGLESGAPCINKRIIIPEFANNPMPLLEWVTQFDVLNKIFSCRLSQDMAQLVIRAGGDPDLIRSDDTMKYAAVATECTCGNYLRRNIDESLLDTSFVHLPTPSSTFQEEAGGGDGGGSSAARHRVHPRHVEFLEQVAKEKSDICSLCLPCVES